MRKLIPTVTPRELEVLALIAQGQTFQQIGDIWASPRKRLRRTHAQLGISSEPRNRSHAIMLAMRRGLILEC
jgi:DNA-binding NarL/FixJ family response regulator